MNSFLRRIAGAAERVAAGYMAQRRRARTMRMINELPPHLRKDVGWPDPDRWLGQRDPLARR